MAGEVQAPVKLWCDTSTGAECDAIMDAFGYDAIIEEVSNPFYQLYGRHQIRFSLRCHPGPYAQMNSILLPHDYLNFYLTGDAEWRL
jgi:xylulokinase